MKRQLTSIGLALVAMCELAQAHPGHGGSSHPSGLWHYVSAPMHAGPVLLATIVIALATRQLFYASRRNSD